MLVFENVGNHLLPKAYYFVFKNQIINTHLKHNFYPNQCQHWEIKNANVKKDTKNKSFVCLHF